jgi:beta-lactamase regulating signal transducer with metallopeptidase domain
MNWNVPVSMHIASIASSFLLQSTLAWLLCLLLARIVKWHRMRCATWTGLLLIFTARWIWMLLTVLSESAEAIEEGVANHAPQLESAHPLSLMPWTANDISALLAVACCGYAAVVLVLSIREVASHLRLRRALSYRQIPPAWLQSTFDCLALSQNIENCSVWLLPGLTTPATHGWWRPQILLPVICEEQEAQEVQAALWHELKHVQRRDALWNSVARLSAVLLWFHPSVHHALGALTKERELACDAEVIRDHPDGRDVYASCLLRFAQLGLLADRSLERCIGLASGVTFLEIRIRAILEEVVDEGRWKPSVRLTVAAVTCAIFLVGVPGVRIFFHSTEPLELNPRSGIAAASIGPRARRPHHSNSSARSRGRTGQTAMLLPPRRQLASDAAYLPSNPTLGAEHRVGANVVAEFTSETDASVTDASVAAKTAEPEPTPSPTPARLPSTGHAQSISWKSVAVQAALKLASMSSGGDNEHRD